MCKEEGKRAEWEYPFAAAGINVTVLLIGLLELQAGGENAGESIG